MKRHESLIPLTHDHHHALAAARRLEKSATADPTERVSQAGTFLEFFGADTITHFREEEEVIFPLVIGAPEAEPVLIRLLLEHVQLHALVAKLRGEVDSGVVAPETTMLIASLLQSHIRHEENVLFPLIEMTAAEPLASVSLSPRDRGAPVSEK